MEGPGTKPGRRACAYWPNCRRGSQCTFRHGEADTRTQQGFGPTMGARSASSNQSSSRQGQGPSNARDSPSTGQNPGPSQQQPGFAGTATQQTPESKFRSMARRQYPLRHLGEGQQLLGAALQCLEKGDAEASIVIQALGSSPDDGTGTVRVHLERIVQQWLQAQQGSSARKVFLDLILPLLRVMTHQSFRGSVHSGCVNAALANLKGWLGPQAGLQRLADGLRELHETSWQPPPAPATPVEHVWAPGCWLDVVEPCVGLLSELMQRFQQQDDFQALKGGAAAVMEVVRALLPTATAGAQRGRVRLLQTNMQAVDSQISHGTQICDLLDTREEAQRRRQQRAAQAAQAASQQLKLHMQSPEYLPGALRPSGARHDNDLEDYCRIMVEPTPQELMCDVGPYLPPNRPGGIPHMASQPSRELLERHFRLLRHDAVSPVALAVQNFKEYGGLQALQALQKQQAAKARAAAAAPGRLRLGSGGDGSLLYVFRHVAFEGLASSPRDGVFYTISFAAPAAVEGRTAADREKWWRMSRRLAHGTLCVLWSEPDGPQHPLLLLAVVMMRDEKELAKERPRLGLRLITTRRVGGGTLGGGDQALRAWLGTGGARDEILLLQENNAFFAYEPVLRALQAQAKRALPLERYLAPGPGAVQANAGRNVPAQVQVPAYLDNDDTTLDLTCLCDAGRMAAMPEAERTRVRGVLSHVDPSVGVGGFPIQELMAATTLDNAQTRALASGLLRELAVIQGPPGTGKTFLGVKLLVALLHNTQSLDATGRSLAFVDDDLMVLDDVPRNANKPHIGPVLVVCFTNHALDSFLEGLLNAGVKSIVRVGSSAKTSEQLKPYNLQSMGDKASGYQIVRLMKKRDEYKQQLELRSNQIKELATSNMARYLPLWDRGGAELFHLCLGPEAAVSMERGRRPARNGPGAGAQSAEADGWQHAAKRKKTTARMDLMQDWSQSNPEADWRLGRLGDLGWEEDMDTSSDEGDEEEGVMDILAILPPLDQAQARQELELRRLRRVQLREWQREQRRAARVVQQEVPGWVRERMGSDRPQDVLVELSHEEGFNVWALSAVERMRLVQYLQQWRFSELLDGIKDVQRDMDAVQKQLQEEYDKASLATLRRARVVGMTTSGVAQRKDLVMALAPKVVMVEEAAEVLEAHVLVCLSQQTQHLILIGDHEQLRPKPNLYQLQAISNSGLDLDVSLFERLVTQQGFPVETLVQQRRMRPDISRLIQPIYPALSDHPSVTQFPPVKGVVHPLLFLDHDHPEAGGDDSGSKSNRWEANMCVALAGYLMQQGYAPEDLIILTAYVGQLFELRRALRASSFTVLLSEKDKDVMADAALDSEDEGDQAPQPRATGPLVLPSGMRKVDNAGTQIRVATIDNFQGEEGKIIILSTVRNNKKGEIGFLKMRNRINVMLSRAQHGMVILGNAASLRANAGRSPLWPQVLQQLESAGRLGPSLPLCCQRHQTVTHVQEPSQFSTLVGDGGCAEACGQLLECGHQCPRRCHVDDPQHVLVRCAQPCDRLHQPCQHPCAKLCHQACGRCEKLIKEPFPLPCGHTIKNIACWRRFKEGAIECEEPTSVALPCGHTQVVPCHEADAYRQGNRRCKQMVEVVQPVCGHQLKVACHEVAAYRADPTRCTAPCGTDLPCGHACKSKCGECMRRSLEKDGHKMINDHVATWDNSAMRQLWAGADAGEPPNTRLARWVAVMTESGLHGQFTAWLKDTLAQTPGRLIHASCTKPCGRNLACGHACSAVCHGTEGCPPCDKRCTRHCNHAKCGKACADPCVACAMACDWRCEHQGACGMPCGTPCDRLPCDLRCAKTLPCGHRCPCVCGERCERHLCVHDSCKARAPERLLNQQVDMIIMREFRDLRDEDVDEDPLIKLECGHVFTRDTLDGLMELAKCYSKHPSGVGWSSVQPLEPEVKTQLPSCILCRLPIQGVRRYGRPLMKAALDVVDLKHTSRCRRLLRSAQVTLQDLNGSVTGWQPTAQLPDTMAQARAYLKAVRDSVQEFARLAQLFDSSPKQRAFEAAYARLQRAHDQSDMTAQDEAMPDAGGAASGPGSSAGAVAGTAAGAGGMAGADATGASRVGTATELEGSGMAAGGGGIVAGASGVQETNVPGDPKRRAAEAAERRALGSSAAGGEPVPDATATGNGGAGGSTLGHQCSVCAAPCAADVCAGCAAAAEAEVQKERMQAQLVAARSALVAVQVDRADLQRTRAGILQAVGVGLRVVVMAASPCKPCKASAKVLEKLQQTILGMFDAFMAGRQAGVAGGSVAEGWVEEALEQRSFTQALQLASDRMSVLLQRAKQQHALGPHLQHLKPQQEWTQEQEACRQRTKTLLEQVESAGDLADEMLAHWMQYSGQDLQVLQTNTTYQHVQEMRRAVPQLRSLLDTLSAEQAVVMLAAAMGHRVSSPQEAANLMAGRTYRCPNGHIFIVGECGMTMQESVCIECGARIGGSNHRLRADNQAVGNLLQELRV